MAKALSSRTLLSLFLAAPLLGCVAKPPPEKPIVLRPPVPERRLARRVQPRLPAQPSAPAKAPVQMVTKAPVNAQTANAAAVEELPPPNQMPAEQPAQDRILTATEKATLFRDFDQYLTRAGHPQ